MITSVLRFVRLLIFVLEFEARNVVYIRHVYYYLSALYVELLGDFDEFLLLLFVLRCLERTGANKELLPDGLATLEVTAPLVEGYFIELSKYLLLVIFLEVWILEDDEVSFLVGEEFFLLKIGFKLFFLY